MFTQDSPGTWEPLHIPPKEYWFIGYPDNKILAYRLSILGRLERKQTYCGGTSNQRKRSEEERYEGSRNNS